VRPTRDGMTPTDPELVARALAGSQDAYRLIVDRHGRSVYNLVARIVRNDGVAEELAQDAFLRAFGALASYDPAFKLSNWLLRIAHNIAIDHLRRVKPGLVSLDDAAGGESLANVLVDARVQSPLERTVQRDLREDIEAALALLRPRFRALIVMRYLEDMSYDEIAAATGLPLGTVKSHLHRARAALARLMTESGWGPEAAEALDAVQPGTGAGS